MNGWLTKFKKWDALSEFFLKIEPLVIIFAVTVIVTLFLLMFGGILYGISSARGESITWLLSIGRFSLGILAIQSFGYVILWAMQIPLFIYDTVNNLKEEMYQIKKKYNNTFNKDNKE